MTDENSLPDVDDSGDEFIEVEDTDLETPALTLPNTLPVKHTDDSDAEDDTPAEEEKPREQMGKRAEKRIRGLVSEKKALETELQELREKMTEQDKLVKQRTSSYETSNLESTEARLKAEGAAAEKDYRDARAMDDTDKEIEAMRRMSTIQTQLMAVNARKNQLAALAKKEPEDDDSEEAPRETRQQTQVQIDDRTRQWAEKNLWVFAERNPDASEEDREMFSVARGLDSYVTNVLGYDPMENPDEYWGYIDEEMTKRFPDSYERENGEKKEAPRKKQQVAAPRQPAGAGKKTIKITKADREFAERFNVDPKRVAVERAKRESK